MHGTFGIDESAETKKKCREVNRLFDEMLSLKDEYGNRVFPNIDSIFQASLGASENTFRRCGEFLRDITTCPEETIRFCQEKLATRH